MNTISQSTPPHSPQSQPASDPVAQIGNAESFESVMAPQEAATEENGEPQTETAQPVQQTIAEEDQAPVEAGLVSESLASITTEIAPEITVELDQILALEANCCNALPKNNIEALIPDSSKHVVSIGVEASIKDLSAEETPEEIPTENIKEDARTISKKAIILAPQTSLIQQDVNQNKIDSLKPDVTGTSKKSPTISKLKISNSDALVQNEVKSEIQETAELDLAPEQIIRHVDKKAMTDLSKTEEFKYSNISVERIDKPFVVDLPLPIKDFHVISNSLQNLSTTPVKVQDTPTLDIQQTAHLKTQVVDSLRSTINENKNSFEIKLDPPEWGQMQVKINMEGSGINVSFSTSNPAVSEALQKSVNDLRQNLMQDGLKLGHVEIGMGQGQQKNENDQQAPGHEREKENDIQPMTPKVLAGMNRWRSSKLVDSMV